MSVPVTTLDEFQRHLASVMTGRADPQAGQVRPAVLTLLGALLGSRHRTDSDSR